MGRREDNLELSTPGSTTHTGEGQTQEYYDSGNQESGLQEQIWNVRGRKHSTKARTLRFLSRNTGQQEKALLTT